MQILGRLNNSELIRAAFVARSRLEKEGFYNLGISGGDRITRSQAVQWIKQHSKTNHLLWCGVSDSGHYRLIMGMTKDQYRQALRSRQTSLERQLKEIQAEFLVLDDLMTPDEFKTYVKGLRNDKKT